MLRADLKAAGIPYRDESGRYADWHALRHTFITNPAGAGVHPRVAQSLAWHCTITLTMDRYTHVVREHEPHHQFPAGLVSAGQAGRISRELRGPSASGDAGADRPGGGLEAGIGQYAAKACPRRSR